MLAKLNTAHLAILTILIRGRDIYGEGRIRIRPSGGVLRISSSQFLCHERATIKGVHLHRVIGDKDNNTVSSYYLILKIK